MPPFLAGGAYPTATYVFPDRFPTSELSNAYVVTGTVRFYLFSYGIICSLPCSRTRTSSISSTSRISRMAHSNARVRLSNLLLKVFCSLKQRSWVQPTASRVRFTL